MKCQEIIKVDVLSEQDSWELFKTNVGDVADSLELHNIAQEVAKECGGLPLAIVTVGRSMRNIEDLRIWNDLLWQLKNSDPIAIDGIRDKVFSIIALSYNRLESEVIKLCFLFCCLFPEDYEIDVDVLTFYGIAEGFMKVDGTLEQARNRVHAIVENLKAHCLLLDGSKEGCVKLHDVVRDVAIWIASEDEHKFLVKAKAQMKILKTEEWKGCMRVSQMNCGITSVDNEMPENQNQGLLTLLLQNNLSLKRLPDNLFQGMESLVVLDLSRTGISTLPPSFPSLVNLRTLCLNYCHNLKDVSQLGRVKKLQTLHLRFTGIQALTEEMGELTNLIFLDLRGTRYIKTIAPNVISRLVCLQELYMENNFSGWEIEDRQQVVRRDLYGSNASFAEVCSLTHLTSLYIDIENVGCLSSDIKGPWRNLKTFHISVGNLTDFDFYPRTMYLRGISEPLYHWSLVLLEKTEKLCFSDCQNDRLDSLRKFISGPLSIDIFGELKCLRVLCCKMLVIILSTDVLLKMQNLEKVEVYYSYKVQVVFNVEGINRGEIVHSKLRVLHLKRLPQLISIWKGVVPPESLQNMEEINIECCIAMRALFSFSVAQSLKKLEHLTIMYCDNIENLISEEELPPGPSIGQTTIFQNLRELTIQSNYGLKSVFPLSVARGLLHLETLFVRSNDKMEELFSMENEEVVDPGIFPQLRTLSLIDLPNLKGFYRASVVLDWPSLKRIHVALCSQLKRLPIGLQSAANLKEIRGEKEWLEALEWEDDNVKKRLQTLFIEDGRQVGELDYCV